MGGRPRLPAEVERQILIESGHRCAVCGDPCPLERAHIIPWHRSREYKAEDMICLCANCHERADNEKWTQATLRDYKHRPWVIRRYERADSVSQVTAKITLTIEVPGFDERLQSVLASWIAGLLHILPYTVRVTSIENGGAKITTDSPKQV